MSGQALADAALALVGTRFRLHGRDPATGLDCIGVLAAALVAIGREAVLPASYALRTRESDDLAAITARCGMKPARHPLRAGDAVLTRPWSCQYHLLVAISSRRFVHAHAGLRQVVIHHGSLATPIVGVWRLDDAARV